MIGIVCLKIWWTLNKVEIQLFMRIPLSHALKPLAKNWAPLQLSWCLESTLSTLLLHFARTISSANTFLAGRGNFCHSTLGGTGQADQALHGRDPVQESEWRQVSKGKRQTLALKRESMKVSQWGRDKFRESDDSRWPCSQLRELRDVSLWALLSSFVKSNENSGELVTGHEITGWVGTNVFLLPALHWFQGSAQYTATYRQMTSPLPGPTQAALASPNWSSRGPQTGDSLSGAMKGKFVLLLALLDRSPLESTPSCFLLRQLSPLPCCLSKGSKQGGLLLPIPLLHLLLLPFVLLCLQHGSPLSPLLPCDS